MQFARTSAAGYKKKLPDIARLLNVDIGDHAMQMATFGNNLIHG